MHTPHWNRRTLIAALLGASSPLGTWAHGPGGHSAHHGHPSPIEKEQKPWGIAGDAQDVQRTIQIRMTDDMRFSPNRIRVKLGETIRLVAINAGQVLHEIVIGTPEELKAHAELMKKHPNMDHDEPYMAHVDPGQRGEIVWTFNRPGEFEFACLIPGHFEAGMTGSITVKR
jgi:uncharacterized cupredoxin-like copper-binding protein